MRRAAVAAAAAKVEVEGFAEDQDGIAAGRRWGFAKLERLRVRECAE